MEDSQRYAYIVVFFARMYMYMYVQMYTAYFITPLPTPTKKTSLLSSLSSVCFCLCLSLSSLSRQSPSSVADDLPRIAQLQNEIEKRDKALLQCKKENDALKVKVTTLYNTDTIHVLVNFSIRDLIWLLSCCRKLSRR